ncbi:MAG: hypothetical protein UV82_C0012G0024 [Candidatus Magasanikbacteria bacterium GW2011_GWD2_43_18]|uniref:TrbC/VIRB2 family protein n=1 Tax=Candidatus Magasanikbacteria bacterium GW2011_GWE2_42_7 TaxID=1619052 RepID=A0A0G1EE47_9BACT|nr:MAG: hypothetical protein UV18_C0005G0111 [Candidatus Magasanikbacteria bacterium GW2011_GWC2_42_27]KKS72793.1 MAG: hypothetical protein UV42_C0004G0005 [Candidatus Magasanikbacteria bacterium GW2011_GWE2_42_7]KKT04039.1 MAG: hypothetical protein UV82_C0012G0024 [Candidatus Magasanikbacteria bacterium GW2011_GWD2_43_18]KKT25953.1 MAG: hypothetical protein UW10_C0003G0114 [Candidatus Magasanikbacteria bacterium GW2011_GWA2_43_9]HBB37928.1 hypothetical protein [Candidatus Magasanikbacteria bac
MKRFISIAISLAFYLGVVSHAYALDLGSTLTQETANRAGYDAAHTTDTTFAETLGVVVKTILSFVGIIFLSLMVYAGYLWMTARGESDQVDKAKKIIVQSIIGLVITVGAYSITAFVVPALLKRTAQ